MNRRISIAKTRKTLEQALASLTYGIARPVDGTTTRVRFAVAFVVPAFLAGIAFGARVSVPAAGLLSGASIVSGVLLALCTLSYNRVKDLSADDRWGGVDPMEAAYRFARSALSATYVSLTATGLLIAQLFVVTGVANTVLLATTLGLIAHLGARLWFLLGGIRHQVEAVGGDRSAQPPKLRSA